MSSPCTPRSSITEHNNIDLPDRSRSTKFPHDDMHSPLSLSFTDQSPHSQRFLWSDGHSPSTTGTYTRGEPKDACNSTDKREKPATAPNTRRESEQSNFSATLVPLSEAVFPSNIPKIPHSEWSKFMIKHSVPTKVPTVTPKNVKSSNSSSGSNPATKALDSEQSSRSRLRSLESSYHSHEDKKTWSRSSL